MADMILANGIDMMLQQLMLMLFVPLVLGPIQLSTEAPFVREISR